MTATLTDTVKFHLSLNVADLAASLAFFETLFGIPPAKARPDYAKFELEEPPVVLSLIPSGTVPGGRLNHAGIRLASSEALVEMQKRLEMAGIRTQREEGVECCYARQTKFWVVDPDRTLWELYVLHEDIEERGSGSVPTELAEHVSRAAMTGAATPARPAALPMASAALSMASASLPMASASLPMAPSTGPAPRASNGASNGSAPAIFQHVLMVPLPKSIPHADHSLDLVRLEGTINARHSTEDLKVFLAEAHRALRPGGEIIVHGLVASVPVADGSFQLPGPAAVVEHVPLETYAQDLLNGAGFAEVRFTKLGEKPCFMAAGAEMREMLLAGRKPDGGACSQAVAVIYKGPFKELADDEGHVYPRGCRVAVCLRTANVLLRSGLAEQFVFLSGTPAGGCGT